MIEAQKMRSLKSKFLWINIPSAILALTVIFLITGYLLQDFKESIIHSQKEMLQREQDSYSQQVSRNFKELLKQNMWNSVLPDVAKSLRGRFPRIGNLASYMEQQKHIRRIVLQPDPYFIKGRVQSTIIYRLSTEGGDQVEMINFSCVQGNQQCLKQLSATAGPPFNSQVDAARRINKEWKKLEIDLAFQISSSLSLMTQYKQEGLIVDTQSIIKENPDRRDEDSTYAFPLSTGRITVYFSDQTIQPAILENQQQTERLIQESVESIEEKYLQILVIFAGVGALMIFLFIGAQIIQINYIINPIKAVALMIRDIAEGEGDLTKRLKITSNDEMGEIAHWLNLFLEKLHDIIANIVKHAEEQLRLSQQLSETSSQIASSSKRVKEQTSTVSLSSSTVTKNVNIVATSTQEISANLTSITNSVEQLSTNINTTAGTAQHVAANMLETNENIEQITSNIEKVSDSAKSTSQTLGEINSNTEEAVTLSNQASQEAQETLDTMNQLGVTAVKVGQIVSLIKNIASQTNMLALNATIEAASAGKSGKGFAVVANEVKDLSNQTAQANNEIAGQIKEIQKQISAAQSSSHNVNKRVTQVAKINRSTNAAMELQSKAAKDASLSIESIATISQQFSNNVSEASQGLEKISQAMDEASLIAHQSARNVSEGAKGIAEIAASSAEASTGVSEVDKELQGIQQAINKVDQGASHALQNTEMLSKMAEELQELVSAFKVKD